MRLFLRRNGFFKSFLLLVSGLLTGVLLLQGCSGTDVDTNSQKYLIKSGEAFISSAQFEQELELKKVAYPYNIKKQAVYYNDMVIQLAQNLSEELVLLRTAREKGIEISEAEMEKAENDFRENYPDGMFEKMLLKNAIDYSVWKQRFRRKLLIDRLIRKELTESIEISPSEVVIFYDRYKTEIQQNSLSESDLIARFRREKAETIYYEWINELQKRYSVSINDKALKRFLVSVD